MQWATPSRILGFVPSMLLEAWGAVRLMQLSGSKLLFGTTKLELVTSGRSVWISLWLSGQYSAAEAATISCRSAASRSASTNPDRTAFMQAAYGTSLRAEPGVSSGARTDKIASVGQALALEDHCFAGVAARTAGGLPGIGPSSLSGVGIGIGWPQQPPSVLGSADECGDPGTARRVANSVKTSPNTGNLCRSLLKSAFGMIKISMAMRARIVAFRLLSESNAISPKYSPGPKVARSSCSPFCSRKTSHSPSSMTYTLSPRSPCWKMISPGSKC